MPGIIYPVDGPRPTSSAAERKLYAALKAQLPQGWRAWHSLRLRSAGYRESEGDFVIAVPKLGIIVVEVKGGRIELIGGRWLQNGRELEVARRQQAQGFVRALCATATTTRGDGKGLDQVFDRIVYSKTLPDLIDDGYLARLKGFRINTAADLMRGKAALAMARGAGPVFRGVCVAHALDGKPLPTGWVAIEAAHPVPDLRSLAAADAVCDLVAAAHPDDEVLALISGGASALIERPVAGLSLEQFVREVQAVAASGVAIHELNAARIARSQLKGGKLAARSAAPVYTLVASDVFDDDLRIVGSGPTAGAPGRPQDRVELVIPIRRLCARVEARRHVR